MQTFVPLAESYVASVACLDTARLGKQRVESMQLITAITGLAFPNAKEIERGKQPGRIFNRGQDRAWQHHPAARMWEGSVYALYCYQVATCREWVARGYLDTCFKKTTALFDEHVVRERSWGRRVPLHVRPPWWGEEAVHASHRANLVRKLPERYSLLWPEVTPATGYVWP